MAEPTSRLIALVLDDDHLRLCDGRHYICSCGYDIRVYDAAEAARKAAKGAPSGPEAVRIAQAAWRRAQAASGAPSAADIEAILKEARGQA